MNANELFNRIVKEYSERIWWTARRFVNSHEDADDLTQDIFLKIWTALPSFRGEAQLFTWVYRIAVNEAMDRLRREKVRAALRFATLDAEMIPGSTELLPRGRFPRRWRPCRRSSARYLY